VPSVLSCKPDIGFLPTPADIVDASLDLAQVTASDVIYDLGCGDGRVVLTAVQRFGCCGVGIDIDPERVQQARHIASEMGVGDRAQFIQQNLFQTQFTEATVVFLYLLPHLNLRLRPALSNQLRPGSRVISRDFDMGDWQADRVLYLSASEESMLYYWEIGATVC